MSKTVLQLIKASFFQRFLIIYANHNAIKMFAAQALATMNLVFLMLFVKYCETIFLSEQESNSVCRAIKKPELKRPVNIFSCCTKLLQVLFICNF